jgi:2-alkenal reductase
MKPLVSIIFLLVFITSSACTQTLTEPESLAIAASQNGTPIVNDNTVTTSSRGADTALPAVPNEPPTANDILEAHESVLRSIYNSVTPSVVHILAISTDSDNSNGTMPTQGEGSGFVWDLNGHIVTNFHVVEGAREVVITFWDGTQEYAEVLGEDPFSDLAVLKVDPATTPLFPILLGDDSALQVGDIALAIGHPFRQRHTMTSGIISAIGRTRPSGTTQFSIPDVIQTDAPINPGNSGGPLLNRLGEVVGINTQIISSANGANSGIGFAVPINIAKRVIPALIEKQEYQYGWLGISGINLTSRHAQQLNLPETTQGVYVHEIVQDSPADKAGLLPSGEPATYVDKLFPEGGSIIISINGESISGMEQLISYLVRMTRPGDTVTLGTLQPNGGTQTREILLGVRPTILP